MPLPAGTAALSETSGESLPLSPTWPIADLAKFRLTASLGSRQETWPPLPVQPPWGLLCAIIISVLFHDSMCSKLPSLLQKFVSIPHASVTLSHFLYSCEIIPFHASLLLFQLDLRWLWALKPVNNISCTRVPSIVFEFLNWLVFR